MRSLLLDLAIEHTLRMHTAHSTFVRRSVHYLQIRVQAMLADVS